MNRPLLAAFLVATMAACSAEGTGESVSGGAGDPTTEGAASTVPEQPAVTPDRPTPKGNATTVSAEADEAGCGADKLGRWLNVLPTETVKTEIAATVGERPIRYYTQGDPITMDFSQSRLNVELGADGRIKLFRCG